MTIPIPNAGDNAKKLDITYITSSNIKMVAILENSLAISLNTKQSLTIKPSKCTPGVCAGELKAEICPASTRVFVAALFVIAPKTI